jgi:hypothetical protein
MKLNETTIGPTTINDNSSYVLIGTYAPGANGDGPFVQRGGELLVQGKVGAGGALNGLKITVSPIKTGNASNHVIVFKKDTDFAAADSNVPFIGGGGLPGTPIYQTIASGWFAFRLRVPAAEISFWAKKATTDTTVQLDICEQTTPAFS